MPEYMTVAQAAAALGISPRAVQKRCANGSLTAQRIGGQWQVLAFDAKRTGEPQNEPQGATRTEPMRTGSHSKRAEPANQNELQNEPATAALLAQSREEILFLRSMLEARDRDAAELRAALRKALEAMPKALPAANNPNAEKIAPENRSGAPIIPAAGVIPVVQKQPAQRDSKSQRLTPWQKVAARILRIR